MGALGGGGRSGNPPPPELVLDTVVPDPSKLVSSEPVFEVSSLLPRPGMEIEKVWPSLRE